MGRHGPIFVSPAILHIPSGRAQIKHPSFTARECATAISDSSDDEPDGDTVRSSPLLAVLVPFPDIVLPVEVGEVVFRIDLDLYDG